MPRKPGYEEQEHLILTYCLTDEQNVLVEKALPSPKLRVFETNCFTDIIAIGAEAILIQADALSDDEAEMLFDFYDEICNSSSDTVIWLGGTQPPKNLQKYLKCYQDFSEIEGKLKYLLLDVHKKQKKSSEFSNSVMYALRILAAIRRKPGITTQELADDCEISKRSVQRYIETLRLSGEWIEYDPSLRGWTLFHGVSMLIGEAIPEEFDK